jgi:hypothetical protein
VGSVVSVYSVFGHRIDELSFRANAPVEPPPKPQASALTGAWAVPSLLTSPLD